MTPSRLGRRHRGQILAGLVSDVDESSGVRSSGARTGAVAALVSAGCVGLAARILPSAGAVLAAGFVVAGIVAPLIAAAALRRATVSLAPVRGALSAAVVDLLRGAADLIAVGATERKLAEIDELDAELTRMARRAAWATGAGAGLAMLAAGGSVWASAVVATPAVRDGRLSGVMVAVVVLLPLAAFEALVPLPQAAVLVTRVRSAAGRLFGLLDEPAAVTEPARRYPCRRAPTRSSCARCRLDGRGGARGFWTTSTSLSRPANTSPSLADPAPESRRSRPCCSDSSIPRIEARCCSTASTVPTWPPTIFAG